MIVHLIDGTYELFRHFYGVRRFTKGEDPPFGAAIGVLNTVLQMVETGATHIGVATDHVIESFRNDLWPGYKTGDGIEPALWRQFRPLEDGLAAMGVAVWPMVELEADDGLASAAHLAARTRPCRRSASGRPTRISRSASTAIASCRSTASRARSATPPACVRSSASIRSSFPTISRSSATAPTAIRGFPGIGAVTAARLITSTDRSKSFPADVLGDKRDLALLFKTLATLRTDAALFDDCRRAAVARADAGSLPRSPNGSAIARLVPRAEQALAKLAGTDCQLVNAWRPLDHSHRTTRTVRFGLVDAAVTLAPSTIY